MKEGREEGRKECVHVLFFWGAATVCVVCVVCVCTLPSLCFFLSSRRCGYGVCWLACVTLGPLRVVHALLPRVNVCVCVCVHMQRAIGTLLLRDDSIAVRRPFKKGAVCCLLLSSLQQRVVGGGVCVHITYIY